MRQWVESLDMLLGESVVLTEEEFDRVLGVMTSNGIEDIQSLALLSEDELISFGLSEGLIKKIKMAVRGRLIKHYQRKAADATREWHKQGASKEGLKAYKRATKAGTKAVRLSGKQDTDRATGSTWQRVERRVNNWRIQRNLKKGTLKRGAPGKAERAWSHVSKFMNRKEIAAQRAQGHHRPSGESMHSVGKRSTTGMSDTIKSGAKLTQRQRARA